MDLRDASAAANRIPTNTERSNLAKVRSKAIKSTPKKKEVVAPIQVRDWTMIVTPSKGVKTKANGNLVKTSRAKIVKTSMGRDKTTIDKIPKKSERKAVKKAEIAVEPPIFEKVDTRLGREEAEQRICVCLMSTVRSVLTDTSCANILSALDLYYRFPSGHWELWTILTVH